MIKRFFDSDAKIYALAAAITGAVIFILIFGISPLIVTNVSFLYDAHDRIYEISDVDLNDLLLGTPHDDTVYMINVNEGGLIDYSLLPSDYVIYYAQNYICFFSRELLKETPACRKVANIGAK